MNINSNLKIIYSQKRIASKSGEKKEFYKLVFCFSNEGFLAQDVLNTIHERIVLQEASEPLCFSALEEIHLFSQELMKELGAPGVTLLSNQEFNIALESTFHMEEIKPLFEKIGTPVAPPQDHTPKKSFFSRIFK